METSKRKTKENIQGCGSLHFQHPPSKCGRTRFCALHLHHATIVWAYLFGLLSSYHTFELISQGIRESRNRAVVDMDNNESGKDTEYWPSHHIQQGLPALHLAIPPGIGTLRTLSCRILTYWSILAGHSAIALCATIGLGVDKPSVLARVPAHQVLMHLVHLGVCQYLALGH